jgi:hypothetical protein
MIALGAGQVASSGVSSGGNHDVATSHRASVPHGEAAGWGLLRQVFEHRREATDEVGISPDHLFERHLEPTLPAGIVGLSLEVVQRSLGAAIANKSFPDGVVEVVEPVIDYRVDVSPGPARETGSLAGDVANQGSDGERGQGGRIHCLPVPPGDDAVSGDKQSRHHQHQPGEHEQGT